MKRVLAGLAAVAIALSAAPSFAQEKLTVWWVKGFYKSEDDALYAAIKKFEAKTGVKVELSQYAVQDMNAEVGGRARCRHRRPTSPIPTPMTCRPRASGRSTASSTTSPTSSGR